MKYIVACSDCGSEVAACPNFYDAEHVAIRHDVLMGHQSTITHVLETPLEGLL